jgi:hypothetical protein
VTNDELLWGGVALLGAWHGVNPAMGWLFAVALGMQERSQGAVWRSLAPLALGHALAVGAAVLAALAAGFVAPVDTVRWLVAAALVGMGIYRLVRGRHPRYGSLRVGAAELTVWSLLMATAHGAGLMVVPLVLHESAAMPGAEPSMQLPSAGSGLGVTLVHTGAYLLVTAAIASVVYRWLGLRQLRRVWVNLDLVWGVALVLTGVATPLF